MLKGGCRRGEGEKRVGMDVEPLKGRFNLKGL